MEYVVHGFKMLQFSSTFHKKKSKLIYYKMLLVLIFSIFRTGLFALRLSHSEFFRTVTVLLFKKPVRLKMPNVLVMVVFSE